MRVLALDTATEACSVALVTEHGLIGESLEVGRGHADRILDMVDRILARGGMSLAGLSGIAAGVGPGSFTGVRVSVAVAQGLAFGAGLPVVPVNSLEALALEAIGGGAERVLACLDARMGEVYWGCFAAQAAGLLSVVASPAVGPPGAVHLPESAGPAQAVRYRGVGRGFAAHPELCAIAGLHIEPDDRHALPQARAMARLGAYRLEAGEGIDPQFLEPLYLRDKVAMTEAERGVIRGVDK